MKNDINEIARLIVSGEEFVCEDGNTYRVVEQLGLQAKSSSNEAWRPAYYKIDNLIKNELIIQAKPWEPETRQEYWTPCFTNEKGIMLRNNNLTCTDTILKLKKLQCKTEAEAQELHDYLVVKVAQWREGRGE